MILFLVGFVGRIQQLFLKLEEGFMKRKAKDRGVTKRLNGGFSLVELIIVIAIMAILAGAMVPAIVRYIDKSRKANDISSAKTIKTAIETAMSDEWVFETLTKGCTLITSVTDMDGETFSVASVISVSNNQQITNSNLGVLVTCDGDADKITISETKISNNIGDCTPKINFKKAADSSKTGAPTAWEGYCTQGGTVIVGIVSSDGFYQLVPSVSRFYQE